MKKDLFVLFVLTTLVGLLLVACDSSNEEATVVPVNTLVPRSTSTPRPTPPPIDILGGVSDDLAEAALEAQSPEAILGNFIDQLKITLREGNWSAVPLVDNSFYGVRPFATEMVSAEEAQKLLASDYLPSGDLIRFNVPVPNHVDTTSYYQGEFPLVSQLASSGWGVDGRANGIVYIVERGLNDFAVAGVLIDYSEFQGNPTLLQNTQPRGAVVQDGTTISQVSPSGTASTLFTHDGTYSINPSVDRALLFDADRSTLALVEFATGEQRPMALGEGIQLAHAGASWLDGGTAIIGVWNEQADEGPNAGHPALLDTVNNTLTLIDTENLMTSPPTAKNGRAVYSVAASEPQLYLWENGALQPTSAETLLNLGAVPNDSSAYSPAISSDGQVAWWIKQTDSEQVALVLNNPDNPRQLLSVMLPSMGGWPTAAVWQPNGSWLAVDVASRFPWESGLWLVNSAEPYQQVYLGNGSGGPVWAGDDALIYDRWVEGVHKTHQYDTSTQQTINIDVADTTRAVGFQIVPLELSVSAEVAPYTRRGVPSAFFLQEGWEIRTVNLYNLFVERGAARLELRAAPRGTYLCVLKDGCNPGEDAQFLTESSRFSPGLNQTIDAYAVFDGERRDQIIFADVDGLADIKAYGFDIRMSLEAIGDYSLTDEDISDAVTMVNSLWIQSDRNSGQRIFTVQDPATLAKEEQFSSPDQVWGATAYVFNPDAPEEHEANRFAGGKYRQVFVLHRRIGNQTWRVRDDLYNLDSTVGSYAPLRWTSDALLFTYRATPDTDRCMPYIQNQGLWRLNLRNGSHTRLLPNHGIFAFTEDQTQLAISTKTGFDLYRLDSRARQIFSFTDNTDLHVQQVQFTPNKESILLIMYVDTPECQAVNQLLMRVDLESGTSEMLREHFGLPLTFDSWVNDENALLSDTNQQAWGLNLKTGEFGER
ncbi:MAG: hypothetical protein ACPG8W_16015 [Candidatus Promineifilaceae bacterium]